MLFLRQSTASQEVRLGKFVDDGTGGGTAGVTARTGLTIANTDIRIFKAGATAAVAKTSGGATHDANGHYVAVLDATDTNTVGSGEITVDVAGALSVRRPFTVLHANVYDWLFGAAAPNTVTPLDAVGVRGAVGLAGASLDTQLSGIHNKTTNLPAQPAAVGSAMTVAANGITSASLADGTLTATKFAAGAFDAVWSVSTRSLTTFGTLVADVAGAVWGVATRTLTAFGFNVTVGANNDKTGYALDTPPPTVGAIAAAVRDVSNAAPAAGSLGEAVSKIPAAGKTHTWRNTVTNETATVAVGEPA